LECIVGGWDVPDVAVEVVDIDGWVVLDRERLGQAEELVLVSHQGVE
jgi:hypothetical protein